MSIPFLGGLIQLGVTLVQFFYYFTYFVGLTRKNIRISEIVF